jgi:hypothetical protein
VGGFSNFFEGGEEEKNFKEKNIEVGVATRVG